MDSIKKKIKNKKARIAVIGLGYVGLPLSILFCKKGFEVIGVDIDKERLKKIKQASSYIDDISDSQLKRFVSGKLKVYAGYKVLAKADIIILCVPTPLSKTGEPELKYIISSVNSLAGYLRKGQLIILESTTYPGTTREEIQPRLEKSGLKLDEDFYLAFSSERINPSNNKYPLNKIPKVVGGVSEKSLNAAKCLYASVFDEVVGVSSAEVAEMSKLLENTFRSVNIGLINQMNKMCHKLGIDAWEVIEAAKTKPFGFMPFYPGPGLGGHCLPADPIYLSWKAKIEGFKEPSIIELAHDINRKMPDYVARKVADALKRRKLKTAGARILIIGVSYKKDISDTRESPAINIIKALARKKAKVTFYDPYVDKLKAAGRTYKSRPLTVKYLRSRDCVLIVTDHTDIDYSFIARNSKLVIDTRNAARQVKDNRDRIVKL